MIGPKINIIFERNKLLNEVLLKYALIKVETGIYSRARPTIAA